MSDYTKSTNFTAKDSLPSGDPNKIIKGADHDTEYENISSMSGTKANKIPSAIANNSVKIKDSTGDIADAGYSFPNLVGAVTVTRNEFNNSLSGLTATAAELNILDGATLTVAELNSLDGITPDAQAGLLVTGTVWTSDTDGIGSGLDADLVRGVNPDTFMVDGYSQIVAGDYLWEVPVGISRVEVQLVGGGQSGESGGDGGTCGKGAANSGGSSYVTYGGVTYLVGGGGSATTCTVGGQSFPGYTQGIGTGSGAQNGSITAGGRGGPSSFGPGAPESPTYSSLAPGYAATWPGAGGGGGAGQDGLPGAGGDSGRMNTTPFILSVTPGFTIAIRVGAGGATSTAGCRGDGGAGADGAGMIHPIN